jgi:L-arabinonolactonase
MTAPAHSPQPVGDFKLTWGESLRWDDQRQRLYFVDCAAHTLHWLDNAEPPVHTMALPTLPTGVVLTDDARLVVALDDGLHLVDPDAEHDELVAAYPEGLGDRANDAAADLDGNLVTGTLNVVPADGSYWWWSSSSGWRQLDDGISNANGPAVIDRDGQQMLVFADTPAAVLYAYDYDGRNGGAENRRVFADTREQGGVPDGTAVDADGGVWSCTLNAGTIVRYGPDGTRSTVDATVDLPSDVTFGGRDLDRLFFVSIAVRLDDYTPITSGAAGRLMVVDDLGYLGRPEPRLHL